VLPTKHDPRWPRHGPSGYAPCRPAHAGTNVFPGAGGGFYASFFAGPRFAIEPQMSLLFSTNGDDSFHVLGVGANATYFLKPAGGATAYVSGGIGTTDSSGSGENPRMFNVGAGYRVPIGNSLAVRMEGRYTRTEVDNLKLNLVGFTVSIGGVFGRR
jgi:hypothetical protein